MTEGHGTCGQPTGSRKRPQGGRITPILLLFAPFGDGRRELLAIRRFHSLRSFHQRLFTFAPFGDGRRELLAIRRFHSLRSFHQRLFTFAPFGDGRRELLAIRRFHSLRSFHQRLFTFAPFGDGRHELPAFPDFSVRRVSPLGVPPDLQSGGALRTHSSSSLFAFQKICKSLRNLTEIIW